MPAVVRPSSRLPLSRVPSHPPAHPRSGALTDQMNPDARPGVTTVLLPLHTLPSHRMLRMHEYPQKCAVLARLRRPSLCHVSRMSPTFHGQHITPAVPSSTDCPFLVNVVHALSLLRDLTDDNPFAQHSSLHIWDPLYGSPRSLTLCDCNECVHEH